MAASTSTPALQRLTANDLAPRISMLSLSAARTAQSDFDLAYQLQMQEAITDSALISAAAAAFPKRIGGRVLGFNDYFRIYTKGLVVEDRNEEKLGAIGVAIFDSSNVAVFEVSKLLALPEAEMIDEVVELEAFVQGLELALSLQMRIVLYSCVHFNVRSYLNGKKRPNVPKVAELVNRAIHLKNGFYRCHISPSKKNAPHVLQLARSSIEKQVGKPFKDIILIKENCPICLEDVNPRKMSEIRGCRHRFCSSCIQTHIQLKLQIRMLPQCPQHKCGFRLNITFYNKFLDPKTRDVMDQLVKESSIPAAEKVYCPNPTCSNLMSKTEALETRMSVACTSRLELTACECVKCGSLFCIECRVIWHSNMSCESYKRGELIWNSRSDDAKLKMLAGNKKWRHCPRCSHMVELSRGCNHISCRCGHEFCYVCGSEWKKKRATCSCALWDERNIIYRGRGANRR